MKRFASILVVIFLFTIVANAETSHNLVWSKDLDNGYISTSPLIVGDQVFVRTSGFWTGDERPHVYSFNLSSGDENWRYKSQTSTQHDISPLLYVTAKTSACGDWPNMLIVGWTDGKVTALNPENGFLIWEIQTEIQTLGVTGKMAIDDDALIVPTRTGIGSYCLADGTTNFYADFGEIGWRNGVTVTDESYLIGNENGSLYDVKKTGEFTKLNNFNGKIRHAPIITTAGILIHLQTDGGSKIYLDNLVISDEGSSPAIPIIDANNVYLATSQSIITLECESSCVEIERKESTSNGEISLIDYGDKSMVSFPINSPGGGWLFGENVSDSEIIFSEFGTYTTAGISTNGKGVLTFGNDNGILYVFSDSTEYSKQEQPSKIYAIAISSILSILILPLVFKRNKQLGFKVGLLVSFILLILIFPQLVNLWSENVSELSPESTDWDDDWPQEWIGTQVVVIELESGNLEVGGLSGFTSVEEITLHVAEEEGIVVEIENYDFGSWVISFNEESGEGWEFTVDGKLSSQGMTDTIIDEDSVVRWKPA